MGHVRTVTGLCMEGNMSHSVNSMCTCIYYIFKVHIDSHMYIHVHVYDVYRTVTVDMMLFYQE